jgi:glutamine amidotransferase
MIEVIDYGGGNQGSLMRSLKRLNTEALPVKKGADLSGRNPVVLPGVGAFAAVMRALKERGFDTALKEKVFGRVPFLGICVGLQVLFESSEESPGVSGLSALKGRVIRYTRGKVPQIGWNRVESRGDEPEGYAYFVNSYYADPESETCVTLTADYFGTFCAGVRQEDITAYQFHPEKSGLYGQELLRRWIDAC